MKGPAIGNVKIGNQPLALYNQRFRLGASNLSTPFTEITGENDQTQARLEHLEGLRQLVGNAYPNQFVRSQVVDPGREDTIAAIVRVLGAAQIELAARRAAGF